MNSIDPFDLTTPEEIEAFMKKYTKRYPQFADEVIWQLFIAHRGNRTKIKKHLKELLKKCDKSKEQKLSWDKIKGLSDSLYQKLFPKKDTLLSVEMTEDISNQWSEI